MPFGDYTRDVEGMMDSIGYRSKEPALRDIMTALSNYRGLHPKVEKFTFNDGIEKSLICLKGTIPVNYRGSTYNIPVNFWILDTHPHHAPMCYVCPTSDMQIRVSRHVDHTGKVYLPYLHEWRSPGSDLLGLIQICIIIFSDQPPVFARQSGAPVNPPLDVGVASSHPGSNTITGEHIRASLMSAVEDKIKRALREEFTTKQAEMESLQRVREELENRRKNLNTQLEMSNRVLEDIQVKLPHLNQLKSELDSNREKIDESQEVDTDEILKVAYPLLLQLCAAYYEDAALDDSLYYLLKGLSDGVIDCEVFLKAVRKLSRDQFFKRLTVQKCCEKAQL